MKKSIKFFLTILATLSFSALANVNDFQEFVSDKSVTYENADGTAQAVLSILDPIASIPTTKQYAQYVMDSYQGWDLKPIIDLRGFSFKYVDNAPCSALLTYFDGRSYLLFRSCGNIDSNTLKELYKKANQTLKLDEILKKQARPTLY